MFVSESILEISYELAVFFLFILAFISCFKSFLLPFIYERFLEIKNSWNELQNKKNLLQRTLVSVEEKSEEQTIQLSVLEKKMKIWHAATLNDINSQQQELEKCIKKLTAKKKKQNEFFHRKKLQQEVIPRAIKKAHEKFEVYYENIEGKKLVSTLLKRLKETTHQPKTS